MKSVPAIKQFFGSGPHGREVTTAELRELSKSERQELGEACAKELGEKFEPSAS